MIHFLFPVDIKNKRWKIMVLKSIAVIRPTVHLTYSYDLLQWLQLRANVNYSYIFKEGKSLLTQLGIGFKF